MADANVEHEAAKFLDKVGDEDKKDPKKLATKLYAVRHKLQSLFSSTLLAKYTERTCVVVEEILLV